MQSLDEQINTIERALGECMIEHALVIVRPWLNELGLDNPYEDAYRTIRARYHDLFVKWLNVDEPGMADELGKLTGDTYQLVDALYADLRLKRGLSPRMHGFSPDSPQSVIQYFSNCIRMTPEDFQWLRSAMNAENTGMALLAITALTRNLRERFSQDAVLTLIDGFDSSNDIVADQCLANVMTLLIHYDIRMDFFPQIQDAFAAALNEMNDGANHAVEVLCALVKSSKANWLEEYATGERAMMDLPVEMQKLINATGIKNDLTTFYNWVPKSEAEYMSGLVAILPQTGLYDILIRGNDVYERALTITYLTIGNRDLMWDFPKVGEEWYVNILRRGANEPADYINYGHCMLLQGDRMMAMEFYRQARQMYKTAKEFYNVFRPDRRVLIEHGVPVEFVYMLEDNLLN